MIIFFIFPVLVLTGHKAVLPCDFDPREEFELGYKDVTFEWKDGKGQDVTHGREQILDNGNLVISDAQPKDSGKYTCVVTSNGVKLYSAKPNHLLGKQ